MPKRAPSGRTEGPHTVTYMIYVPRKWRIVLDAWREAIARSDPHMRIYIGATLKEDVGYVGITCVDDAVAEALTASLCRAFEARMKGTTWIALDRP